MNPSYATKVSSYGKEEKTRRRCTLIRNFDHHGPQEVEVGLCFVGVVVIVIVIVTVNSRIFIFYSIILSTLSRQSSSVHDKWCIYSVVLSPSRYIVLYLLGCSRK